MKNFLKIPEKIGRYGRSFFISFFTARIDEKGFDETYHRMKKQYVERKNTFDYAKYVMTEWQSNTDAIETYFLNNFSIAFLRNSIIKNTMFMYTLAPWKNIQKTLIGQQMNHQQAEEILKEYNIGKPLLNDWYYLSSGNNIHHLYHLLKFFKETGTSAADMNKIVEVGGGYGNMAKIFKKLNPDCTYVIIDIPIFSYIQAVYLKTLLGEDSVSIGEKIEKGKINLIPLNDATIRQTKDMLPDTDLFISTWALSESNEHMQQLVKELGYFNATYLLLAYQKSNSSFGFAERIKDVSPHYKTIFSEETEYLKDNFYLFAKSDILTP